MGRGRGILNKLGLLRKQIQQPIGLGWLSSGGLARCGASQPSTRGALEHVGLYWAAVGLCWAALGLYWAAMGSYRAAVGLYWAAVGLYWAAAGLC